MGILAGVLGAAPALAQSLNTGIEEGGAFQQALGLGTGDIKIIIANIIRIFLGLLGVIAVSLIVYGGFLWMTSAGNEERTHKARMVITNAIIGLVIIMMSFIIVSFVLNKLLAATGFGGGTFDEPPTCDGCIPPDYSSVFTIDSVSPQGDQTIKNLTVRLTFNKDVDAATVSDNITVTADGSDTPVTGTFSVVGDRVSFHPDAVCEGYPEEYCFDSNTPYTITLGSGLRSIEELALSCGGFYDSCTYTFTSGELVDTQPPSVSVTSPEYGDSVSVNALVPIQAHVEDDGGVAEVEFYVDGNLIDTIQPDGDTPLTFDATIDWDTSALTALERYGLTAVAYDVNDHSERSDEVRVIARAEHCFNGDYPTTDPNFPDADEEGEDCGGADCGACDGSSCRASEDFTCAATCVDGVCTDVPEITAVSPLNGAVGSYVTISGTNFGSRVGSVKFGDVEAELANCDDAWQTFQVIAVVPERLTVGETYPITLTTADGYTDTTNDDYGTPIDDFEVNTTVRPGICAVGPSYGEVGSFTTVYGNNFGATQGDGTIYFGTEAASAYASWNDSQVKVDVPTLVAKDYFMTLWVGGVSSNDVNFTVVDSDAEEAPYIDSVSPTSGPIGQYVTITGSGFGSTPDLVYFINNNPDSPDYGGRFEADVDFPAVCEDNYWSHTQIIVKVPIGLGQTDYLIEVRKDDQLSNDADFAVTAGTASPGICLVSPSAAPVGYPSVTLSGEGFGTTTGEVHFYDGSEGGDTSIASSWSDTEAVVEVPVGATSGPVILYDALFRSSNAVNFDVGDCNTQNVCDANTQQCCASGACIGANDVCPEAAQVNAEYVWEFSTGAIPVVPTVQARCSTTMISPTPWSGRAGGESVCVNAGISATFDVAMDTASLKADGNITLGACSDATCASSTPVDLGDVSTTATSFAVYPTSSLAPGTTYQVVLSSAITSSLGVAIAPTRWTFTTSTDANDCAYAGVMVSPSLATIEEQDGLATFNAAALAEDACIILNNNDTTWSWSVDPSDRYVSFSDAAVAGCTGEPTSCQTVMGIAEGDSIVTAEESTQGLDDDAEVDVNFTNPYAVDYWPGCSNGGTACLNAAIGAQFNTTMDDVTVESAGAIHLYACSDESCSTHTEDIGIDVERSDADETVVNITLNDDDYPSGNLATRTYYEVVFSSAIESQSGVPLNEHYNGDFSWTFLTRATDEICAVDHVVVDPSASTVTYVGATSVFDSVPYGDPDDCSTSGQRLTATGYDWGWSIANTTIANLWQDGVPVQVVEDRIPDGCTTSCLSEGTLSYEAICGEDADGDGSLLDPGEDCDNGTGLAGAGCSSTCQSLGTTACSSEEGSNCCGNNNLDTGEECDDGNTANSDGCSNVCLNEGEAGGVSTCGDEGIVTHSDLVNSRGWAGGEDCDDGNTDSGDGCSNLCLNEGSVSRRDLNGICGDGEVDAPAEQCDDSGTRNGDGCSEYCLYEGSDACSNPTSDRNCCGNEQTEASAFESCDDGNTVNGDGCSAVCLLEGSSRGYATPSWCGDGTTGTGEAPADTVSACEVSLSSLDGFVEPEQVAVIASTAPGEVVDGLASTTVSAAAEGETGQAALNLSCSCAEDNQCTSSDSSLSLGCGTGGCCYERPKFLGYTPSDGDACRNALVAFDFDTEMALATFTDNLTIELVLEGDEACPYSSSSTAFDTSGNVFVKVWSSAKHLLSRLVDPAQASDTACYLPITFTSSPTEDGGERVTAIYTQLLEADRSYIVSIKGDPSHDGSGVRSATGVGLDHNYARVISIGDNVCSFDTVSVQDVDADSPGLFTTVGEAHPYTATAMTMIGGVAQAIVPIPDVYDWDWSKTWWSTDDTVLQVGTQTDSGSESNNTVTAQNDNGTASIYASAQITDDTLFSPSTALTNVYGSAEATTNLCKNPWPALKSGHSWDPFRDGAFGNHDPDGDGVVEVMRGAGWMHFTTYYCRDDIGISTNENGAEVSATGTAADVVFVEDPPSDVLKEYLFKLSGGDAVGIRIAKNDDLLSIGDWYDAQGFTGAPSETTVDGYQALRDGRTVYVSAANVSGDFSGTIYPNVYVISYNEGASEETIAIFDQMLDNWQFNSNISNDGICYEVTGDSAGEPTFDADGQTVSCTSDLDCTSGACRAGKDKLSRDMQRLTDVKEIAGDLQAYGEANGRCSATSTTSCTSDSDCPGVETCQALYPTIDSGSFLRAQSSSAWDSWQNVLGTTLGVTLPTDPLNAYAECGTTGGSYGDYNADTCWYEAGAQYACPTGSHVYNYKNIGGTAYRVWTDLEYHYESGVTEWHGRVDSEVADGLSVVAGQAFTGIVDGFQEDATCDGTVMGNSAACGDGVIGESETCEIGDTSTTSCHALTCLSADPDYDGAACLVDCADTTICPGGDKNADGICDGGPAGGQACGTGDVDCTDTSICSTYPYFERTEGTQVTTCDRSTCDAFSAAADAACVPFRCGNGVVDDGEDCDDGSHNGNYGYCGTSCQWDSTAFYCGDGTLAGGEVCDKGASNGQYALSSADTCSATCDGPGLYCGDSVVNGSEVCDGTSETWAGSLCPDGVTTCTSNADCGGNTCGAGGLIYNGACPTASLCVGGDYDGFPCGNFSWPDAVSIMSGYSDFAIDFTEGAYGVLCQNYGGTCVDSAVYPTYHIRSCNDSGTSADCSWNTWQDFCKADTASCGNGVVDGTEACDDGNDSNNDSCTNQCTVNICGDGYLYTDHESCDRAEENGQECTADYGSTCRYCSYDCTYLTSSGSYCGDGVVQDSDELCDGSELTQFRCFDDATTQQVGDVCYEANAAEGSGCESGFTCRNLGVCNGGLNDGMYCTQTDAVSGKDLAFCAGGTCVLPTCADDCGSTCPFSYADQAVDVTSEEAGATANDSISLYSLDTDGSPNLATLTIPACRIESGLTADISDADRDYSDVDIMFVLDDSQSMGEPLGSSTGLEVLRDAVSDAIDQLYDAYHGTNAEVRIGFAFIGGKHGYDLDGDGVYETVDDYGTTEFFNFAYDFGEERYFVDDTQEGDLDAAITTALSVTYHADKKTESIQCYNPDEDPSCVEVTGTPLIQVLRSVKDAFANDTNVGDDDAKYVILFTDGDIKNDASELTAVEDAFALTDASHKSYVEQVTDTIDELKDSGITLFSAAFAESDSCGAYQAAKWSNMDCSPAERVCEKQYDEGDYSCEPPSNNITYAYSATDADGLVEMYQSIIDAILNVTVTLTDADGNTATSTVDIGDSIDLPLPVFFACDASAESNLNIEVTFTGSGAIEFSNIQLNMCSP